MSFYVRVKRGKQTYFVTMKPTDNILKLKHTLAGLLAKKRDPKHIRILLPKSSGSSGILPGQPVTAEKLKEIEEKKKEKNVPQTEALGGASSHQASNQVPESQATLSSLGVQNDGVLYMVFPMEDGGDVWETVQVPDFEPLNEEFMVV